MTDAELAAERLAALLDAEREIERLRDQLEVRIRYSNSLRTMLESATETERAAVVAYLRGFYLRSFGDICADMADCIERGEHRNKEKK